MIVKGIETTHLILCYATVLRDPENPRDCDVGSNDVRVICTHIDDVSFTSWYGNAFDVVEVARAAMMTMDGKRGSRLVVDIYLYNVPLRPPVTIWPCPCTTSHRTALRAGATDPRLTALPVEPSYNEREERRGEESVCTHTVYIHVTIK